MCVMSMVGDHYKDTLPKQYPGWFPGQDKSAGWPTLLPPQMPAEVSKAEFEALKKDVEYIKTLLEKAKELDIATGQPNCEMDEKVAVLKALADLVGVDLKDVFGK